MLRPGVSCQTLRSMSNSLRNLSNLDDDKLLNQTMPTYSVTNSVQNLNSSKPDQQLSTRTNFTRNPQIIVTDENSVIHKSGSFMEQPDERLLNLISPLDVSSLTHLYFRRWIILFIFSFISLLSAFNWIEYNIIQDVTIQFYNKSLPAGKDNQNSAVNWFSMVYMLCYTPLVFPAMFLLEKKGLKLSILLGGLLTTIGSIIKCFAAKPEYFLLAIVGQTICAIAQAFTLSVPARLSALWFGPKQIALATSIGVFGNQLGVAAGFLIPPMVVLKSDDIEDMQRRFLYLLVPLAILSGLATIAGFLLIKDQPEKPPSLAQLEIRNQTIKFEQTMNSNKQSDFELFRKSLANLFKNFNFLLILVTYGINTGVYYAIGTLLYQIVAFYYENEGEKIGIIGLTLVLSGLLGALIGGIVLDRTKAYKATTFIIYAFSFASMLLFSLTLSINIWIVFGSAFLLGFFMTGYLPVGFELAAEVTYPEPEGSSCGLLNSSAQVFGIIFTYIQGRLITSYGPFTGNMFASVALFIGTIITGFIKSDLRRQKATYRQPIELDETAVETKVQFDENNNPIA